jgi:UDP-2-acetamido-3-amino-2,3-dideoxy-glucuronate N-acetyltransferase
VPISDTVKLGKQVRIPQPDLVNLFGCSVDEDTMIGPFVEIQANVVIGKRCKIQSHTFICEGVTIEDEVFVGHGVMFTNDRYPRATNSDGSLKSVFDWKLESTLVSRRTSIGSGATILCGIVLGENSVIAAGATVTRDVPPNTIVAGCPAKEIGKVSEQ